MNVYEILQNTAKPKWYRWMSRHFYYLHQHPERSYQETNTIRYITKVLKNDLGLEPKRFPINGEVFGEQVSSQAIAVSFGSGTKTVIFTADFDALPIQEALPLWYRSQTKDTMHACGHDLHTSILLGMAWWLKQNENILTCRVVLLFRPAEEQNGAYFMVQSEELLTYLGQEAICIGLHVYPKLPAGKIATRSGLMNYSVELLKIKINGKAGHTARPEHENSALTIAGQILSQLPTMIANEIPEVVFAFGQVHGGNSANAIPDTVWCEGTLRSPTSLDHQKAKNRIIEYAKHINTDVVTVSIENAGLPPIPPVINDTTLVNHCLSVSKYFPWIEVQHTEASKGADDIASFSELGFPLHYFWLGTKPDHQKQIYDLHSPYFEADPRALLTGVYFQLYQLIKFMEQQ